jgi:hypothetical protein
LIYYTLLIDHAGATTMVRADSAIAHDAISDTAVAVMTFQAVTDEHATRILRAVLEVSSVASRLDWRSRCARTR